jgi:DnaK suppressor protein
MATKTKKNVKPTVKKPVKKSPPPQKESAAKKSAKPAAAKSAKKKKPVAKKAAIKASAKKQLTKPTPKGLTYGPSCSMRDGMTFENVTPPKSLKTTLSAKELEHFKKIIEKRRQDTLADLTYLKESINDPSNNDSVNESSSYSLHMADHGTETMDREQKFQFVARDEKYIMYLDRALQRIKNKTFGMCSICGLRLPEGRIEAVPHTTVCLEYKRRH